ncbi:MAG: hypothetical protein GX621_12470 [Pirellulaceae bacterium]|nr:hypothetical protein [Pirellulaceae bacterium]
MALSEAERDSAAGRALIRDADRRARRIDVASRVRLAPSRRWLLPLVPAVLVFLVMVFVGPDRSASKAQAKTDAAKVEQQVKKAAKDLERKLIEQRKKAEDKDLREVKDILRELERDLKKLHDSPPAEREKALAKINDLAKQLKEQRDKKGGADKLRDQLRKLDHLKQGPAERLAKAMKEGDFKKAAEELDKLREQLASDKMDPKQREELAKQMGQMAEKLKSIADAHAQAEQQLQEQIRKAKDAGDLEKASKLEEQLAELRDKLPKIDALDKLAEQLQQCAKQCEGGNADEAQECMKQLAENLEGLQQDLDQLEMLDEAMEQLAQCGDGMCEQGDMPGECPACGGQGCPECEGRKTGTGLMAGEGHVPGTGGPRGKMPENLGFRDTRVPQKVGTGPLTVVGHADGPNRAGEVPDEIKTQYEAARRGETDPLTNQQMPRTHRRHAREYLDRLRTGE